MRGDQKMSAYEGCRHFLTINCANAVAELLRSSSTNIRNLPPMHCFIREIQFEATGLECELCLATTEATDCLAEICPAAWGELLRDMMLADSENLGFIFWCLLAPTETEDEDSSQDFVVILVKLLGYEAVAYKFTPEIEFVERAEPFKYLPMFALNLEEAEEVH